MRFKSILTGFSLLVIFCFSAPVKADNLLEVYHAHLGMDDHYNSRGQRLGNAAAIIRQDRANYHRFGVRQAGDTGDEFFSSKRNRAILEGMLRRGNAPRWVLNRIVNGTPTVTVRIYPDYITVVVD